MKIVKDSLGRSEIVGDGELVEGWNPIPRNLNPLAYFKKKPSINERATALVKKLYDKYAPGYKIQRQGVSFEIEMRDGTVRLISAMFNPFTKTLNLISRPGEGFSGETFSTNFGTRELSFKMPSDPFTESNAKKLVGQKNG
jgi:hypothetical protein